MNKIALFIVLIVTVSCYADSLFRYVVIGDGYNPEGIVLGKYGPEFLWNSDMIFPVEDYENVEKKKPQFDEVTNKKLKELNDALMAALDKDPKQEKLIEELNAMEAAAMKEWDKISKKVEEKMFPTESYSKIINNRPAEIVKSAAYQKLLEEFQNIYRTCLPKMEKLEREIIEELRKRNMEPTGEWFPGLPSVEYSKLPQDMRDKFANQLKEIGVIFYPNGVVQEPTAGTLFQDCSQYQQLQEIAMKIYETLEYDSQIVAATEKYKKAIIAQDRYGALYRHALKRELGVERIVREIKPTVEEKIKSLGIREKLREIRKTLSPDILKAQQAYDAAVDLFINKAEKEVEKILAERKVQKTVLEVVK